MPGWYGRLSPSVNAACGRPRPAASIRQVSEEENWSRDLASRLEPLVEISGTAMAASGLFLVLQGLPAFNESFLGLPPGFAGRDTGAFLAAVLVGVVLMPVLLRRLLDGWPVGRVLGRPRTSAGSAVGAGLMVAAALTLWSQFLLLVAPEVLLPAWRSLGVTSAPHLWAAVFFVAPLATALPEEIFFRGYGQGLLAGSCGRGWGLLLTAVVFSLAHAGQGWSSVVLAIFPAAMALGILYDATGSVLAPWVAHTATNAAAFISMGTTALYPEAGRWTVAALMVLCVATLWAGRRQAAPGLAHVMGLGRSSGEDMRGLFLLVTAGLAAMAAGIFLDGLLRPLIAGDGHRVLASGLVLWVLALIIHNRRGAAWGTAPSTPGR